MSILSVFDQKKKLKTTKANANVYTTHLSVLFLYGIY